MLLWMVPLVLFVLSLTVAGTIAFRHYSEVVAVNPDTDPERRKRKHKQSLFAKRIERMGVERTKEVGRAVGQVGRATKGWVKRLYVKAQVLERHYRRLQKESKRGSEGTKEMREHLLKEAEELIEREAYHAAEQRLIELISLDPKNAMVYERLGTVYVALRQYVQAKETFAYALTLAPEDASIHVHLGEVAMRDGQVNDAVESFQKAVDLRPANPKYLDFLIESSILAGDKASARKAVGLLKDANPDNQKIEAFEARIASMTS